MAKFSGIWKGNGGSRQACPGLVPGIAENAKDSWILASLRTLRTLRALRDPFEKPTPKTGVDF
ncbi:MAG: hypothetical protein WD750_02610, partial [Gammaproteobacteria bacterium]